MNNHDRHSARQKTIILYSQKYRVPGNFKSNYTGDFPCQELADSIAIAGTARLAEHQACWNDLYQKFDKAWRAYAREESATGAGQ